jgi:5-methylcytosine-specific restriction protein B
MYRESDQKIYTKYSEFINTFFIEGKNFLENNGEEIFKKIYIDECIERFVDNPNNKKKDFTYEANALLAGASEKSKKILSHAIWLWGFSIEETKNCHLIFIDNDKKDVKAKFVNRGFAKAGVYHKGNKSYEICFVMRLFKAIRDICDEKKEKDIVNEKYIRKQIVTLCLLNNYKDEDYEILKNNFEGYFENEEDYNKFSKYDLIQKDTRKHSMADILLYLSAPEEFERIVSNNHKWQIVNYFKDFRGIKEEDLSSCLLDKKIKLIREELEKGAKDKEVDFYDFPFSAWKSDFDGINDNALSGLKWKKNIVLYGPPGTGKTYSAEKLAKNFIAREKLRKKEIELSDFADIYEKENGKENSKETIIRLQLHSNYGYEQFIIGQTLCDGKISTVKGRFLEICEEAANDKDNVYVLILDEINRVDLARLFGEAFSAIENRNTSIKLPYKSDNGDEIELCVPDNLYIIGTMNEIDFSLERLDFALRRRFWWYRYGFSDGTLCEMLDSSIKEDDRVKFVKCAKSVNERIKKITPELGEQYEVGHTFFAEINNICKELGDKNLYNTKSPREAVKILWEISIKPMIESYLDNIDTGRKEEIIKELENEYYGI